uniref:hypothetical protein n=1 Tax=Streptomyces sp. NBC_00998 TaxID=2903712 RepID=UPI002F90B035|nr:hypothetical protein OG513_39450 [Streptomyces sp. NBC_00998]
MDETLDLLDTLLDGVSEPRLNLISEDEARALMVLLGLLDDADQSEDIRRGRGRDAVPDRLTPRLNPAPGRLRLRNRLVSKAQVVGLLREVGV